MDGALVQTCAWQYGVSATHLSVASRKTLTLTQPLTLCLNLHRVGGLRSEAAAMSPMSGGKPGRADIDGVQVRPPDSPQLFSSPGPRSAAATARNEKRTAPDAANDHERTLWTVSVGLNQFPSRKLSATCPCPACSLLCGFAAAVNSWPGRCHVFLRMQIQLTLKTAVEWLISSTIYHWMSLVLPKQAFVNKHFTVQ
ncbi:hypothetical protein AAFF_G00402640, partial [Aldrovandia affinis]